MPQTHSGSWDGIPVQSIAGLSGVLALSDFGIDQVWTPSYNGLLYSTGDPSLAQNTGLCVSGTKYVVRVPVSASQIVSNIWVVVTTAGSTLTSNQNLAGLYSSTGAQLGVTADQSAVWNSTGAKSMALTAAASVTSPYVYVELMSNGTTPATFSRFGQTTAANLNVSGATLRAATTGTGATALDASFTPSSGLLTTNTPFTFWVGLS